MGKLTISLSGMALAAITSSSLGCIFALRHSGTCRGAIAEVANLQLIKHNGLTSPVKSTGRPSPAALIASNLFSCLALNR
ncbi:hypothetical protein SLEP1_g56213 [Rubroshorea leprosula]|uniref:Uncharacterized protein n=1 Tax=Rubroshorea leprosula TaxID=152421 RepID=A0AAV5MHP0_9ROSI|nr:hypothetical protein SLEP1_g56213 [Rubroshorea leprosula]